MNLLLQYMLVLLQLTAAQVTYKKNILLSRQRRYLLFPKGANFVITMSGVKAVMVTFPPSTNFVLECDVPFPLPFETRLLKKYRHRLRHRLQRREILDRLESSLLQLGLNGRACIEEMICEANNYIQSKKQTFVGDLMATVFYDLNLVGGNRSIGVLESHDYLYNCDNVSLSEKCPIPFYHMLTKAFSSSVPETN